MTAVMTTTWIMRKCRTCRTMTVHDHTRGESRKARWIEYVCHGCGRKFNATTRKKKSCALDSYAPSRDVRRAQA